MHDCDVSTQSSQHSHTELAPFSHLFFSRLNRQLIGGIATSRSPNTSMWSFTTFPLQIRIRLSSWIFRFIDKCIFVWLKMKYRATIPSPPQFTKHRWSANLHGIHVRCQICGRIYVYVWGTYHFVFVAAVWCVRRVGSSRCPARKMAATQIKCTKSISTFCPCNRGWTIQTDSSNFGFTLISTTEQLTIKNEKISNKKIISTCDMCYSDRCFSLFIYWWKRKPLELMLYICISLTDGRDWLEKFVLIVSGVTVVLPENNIKPRYLIWIRSIELSFFYSLAIGYRFLHSYHHQAHSALRLSICVCRGKSDEHKSWEKKQYSQWNEAPAHNSILLMY